MLERRRLRAHRRLMHTVPVRLHRLLFRPVLHAARQPVRQQPVPERCAVRARRQRLHRLLLPVPHVLLRTVLPGRVQRMYQSRMPERRTVCDHAQWRLH